MTKLLNPSEHITFHEAQNILSSIVLKGRQVCVCLDCRKIIDSPIPINCPGCGKAKKPAKMNAKLVRHIRLIDREDVAKAQATNPPTP